MAARRWSSFGTVRYRSGWWRCRSTATHMTMQSMNRATTSGQERPPAAVQSGRSIWSRHTANSVLKQAGPPQQFWSRGLKPRLLITCSASTRSAVAALPRNKPAGRRAARWTTVHRLAHRCPRVPVERQVSRVMVTGRCGSIPAQYDRRPTSTQNHALACQAADRHERFFTLQSGPSAFPS